MKNVDALLGRWMAGDARAAAQIYQAYHARVRSFAVKLGKSLADADDVAQEALVAGLEGLKAGKRPDRLTTWLLGIAKNVSRKRPRGAVPKDLPLPDPTATGARTRAVKGELDKVLRGGLHGLADENRRILEWLHRDGLTRAEVARRLGVPVETVHARCERAYAKLRGLLSRHFTTLAFRPSTVVTLAAIRRLRPAFRDAVIVRHVEDLGEKEAARKLGVPVATLRARLQSAYTKLRCAPTSDFRKARADYRGTAE